MASPISPFFFQTCIGNYVRGNPHIEDSPVAHAQQKWAGLVAAAAAAEETRRAWQNAMASRSLTALGDKAERSLATVTSLVSVVHEKTVVAFRCNKRGCERVIHPMLVLAVMVASIALVGVATGTQVWVEVSVCGVDVLANAPWLWECLREHHDYNKPNAERGARFFCDCDFFVVLCLLVYRWRLNEI